jgi:capsular polysaccharide transport system permease protein
VDELADKTETHNPKPEQASKEKPTGVHIVTGRTTKSQRRRAILAISFLLLCALPSIMAVAYYTVIASERYAASAGFVVRGLNTSAGSADLVSSFTGLTSTGSTTSDSYIIRRFLESADLIRLLQEDLALTEHYADLGVDPISRFNGNEPFEEFVFYWQRRISTTYDSTTGIVTFEVQGFDPNFTLALADRVLLAATELVNQLSESARQDSVQFATREVDRAEARLSEAQQAIRQFRSDRGSVDPTLNAQLDAELIASLEAQLADVQARREALSASVEADTPLLRQMEQVAAALRTQIAARRAAIGDNVGEAGTATAETLAEFEALQLQLTFAQQRYASALSSLENALMDADRQQRYLAIFSRPFMPEEAMYPLALRNVMLIVFGSFALWAISSLVAYAVRDHLN